MVIRIEQYAPPQHLGNELMDVSFKIEQDIIEKTGTTRDIARLLVARMLNKFGQYLYNSVPEVVEVYSHNNGGIEAMSMDSENDNEEDGEKDETPC